MLHQLQGRSASVNLAAPCVHCMKHLLSTYCVPDPKANTGCTLPAQALPDLARGGVLGTRVAVAKIEVVSMHRGGVINNQEDCLEEAASELG